MIVAEDIVDFAETILENKPLPLIVLGDCDPVTDELRARGVRFLETSHLTHLVKALFLIVSWDDAYAEYAFPRGSVVVDPFEGVQPSFGVTLHHPRDEPSQEVED